MKEKLSKQITTITVQKGGDLPKKYYFYEKDYKEAVGGTREVAYSNDRQLNKIHPKSRSNHIGYTNDITTESLPIQIDETADLFINFDYNFSNKKIVYIIKNYREEAVKLITGKNNYKSYETNGPIENENCKLNEIFTEWKYGILDNTKTTNNNIIIFKRNIETNNLDIIKVYDDFKKNDSKQKIRKISKYIEIKKNTPYPTDMPFSNLIELLFDNCNLYLISSDNILTKTSLPEDIKSIEYLEKSECFGVKFTEKDYRETTLKLIFGKNYIKNNEATYKINEGCELNEIINNWEYAIVDGSNNNNNNYIIIYKRNKDNNLDMIKVYHNFKNESFNNKNNSEKTNIPLFHFGNFLFHDNLKLYIIKPKFCYTNSSSNGCTEVINLNNKFRNSLPDTLGNISDLNKYFGDNFSQKDYKEETIKLIFLGKNIKNGNRNYENYAINKECKLNQILDNWKYAIVDCSKVTNNNLILIYKRNKDNNLDIIKVYIDFINTPFHNKNDSLKINVSLISIREYLIRPTCKLYLISYDNTL